MMAPDWTLPLHCTGVFGCSGSGKTTLVERYIRNSPDLVLCSAFDFKAEMAKRLSLPLVGTVAEMEAALKTRYVMFNPHRMFPGKIKEAFAFWCKWFYEVSKRGRGRKLAYIDEPWKFCSPNSIPEELAEMVQAGRSYGVETIFSSQRPNRLNESIINELTEIVCFKLRGKNAIETVADQGIPDEVPRNLKKGRFYALNTDTDGVREGKLF